jgi:hypothetical protein
LLGDETFDATILVNMQRTMVLSECKGSPSKEYGEANNTLHDEIVLDCKDTFF